MTLFLPCAAGVEGFLADEVHRLTGLAGDDLLVGRAGVLLRAGWDQALRLNLHSRLAQRVLVQVAHGPYRNEADLYELAHGVAWETWFQARQRFKVELTAQHSPLKSLNFATLKVKDAVVDRFRERAGTRPDVDTQRPDVRLHAHLGPAEATLYVDTSGEPLFKRGWREDKGEAPLKETLAAAMLAASGWDAEVPLYDPFCGSGTIAIEAAQLACRIAPGSRRRFGFERLLPFEASAWTQLKAEAEQMQRPSPVPIHGSDVAFRMVDFANRNAERAGVAGMVQFRGGDALQRLPPVQEPGVMLVNPPYGERIESAGFAGRSQAGRERAQTDEAGDFFAALAAHWKKNYAGWTAYVLTPDLKLPTRMRLKESRRVPMWNGPIECRLFRFDMVAGSARVRGGHA
ncbi:class I SAM-dependent RNA methyltransferase [Ramlibacter sp. AW1]|uniref:Class I SAM-dependent RNA methyltransferase n=2 Tax=Ramlibacter aurantiacus TaxID=2801330 RepID=A0A937D463_9BURK|nr:class I SAM-dependent RNA methyltransferase [Ramlibacter aurantiacus]